MNTTYTTANLLATGADELERLALEEIIRRQPTRFRPWLSLMAATDLAGCHGCQLAPASPLATTPHRQSARWPWPLAFWFRDEIAFSTFDFLGLADTLTGEPFDVAVIQRGLCGR